MFLHLVEKIVHLSIQISNLSILILSGILQSLKLIMKSLQFLLGPLDSFKSSLLFKLKHFYLIIHSLLSLFLRAENLLLLFFKDLVLLDHFVKLIHTTVVENNMLLDVGFVALHDIS